GGKFIRCVGKHARTFHLYFSLVPRSLIYHFIFLSPHMVSKYDHLLTGLLTALIVSVLGYYLLNMVAGWISESATRPIAFQERTLALIALCLNLVPMNIFRKIYHNKSLRGLVLGTMILAGVWFFQFGQELLGN
ncbi:MAG: hypothetical protein AAGA62_05920, partial [Bacteroidota bacterium]